ncbi:hypothetical protein OH76DRAFT_279594 [Lentinus brumalis]|uniref:Uncharacterized protein n=1 Tax=Lentinus brumalis TaxID=2498619 RepID=A0A371CKY2_9APHY|nr:hypothetical protein OH76DRAFT_279594 [Polyporus brumalis]
MCYQPILSRGTLACRRVVDDDGRCGGIPSLALFLELRVQHCLRSVPIPHGLRCTLDACGRSSLTLRFISTLGSRRQVYLPGNLTLRLCTSRQLLRQCLGYLSLILLHATLSRTPSSRDSSSCIWALRRPSCLHGPLTLASLAFCAFRRCRSPTWTLLSCRHGLRGLLVATHRRRPELSSWLR